VQFQNAKSIHQSLDMVSEKALRPLIWAIKLGSFIYAYPAIWDSQQNRIQIDYGMKRFKRFVVPVGPILRIYYLIVEIVSAAYILLFPLISENNVNDWYISILFLAVCSMGFCAQIVFYFSFENFAAITNAFLVLDEKIRKYNYKANNKKTITINLFCNSQILLQSSTFGWVKDGCLEWFRCISQRIRATQHRRVFRIIPDIPLCP